MTEYGPFTVHDLFVGYAKHIGPDGTQRIVTRSVDLEGRVVFGAIDFDNERPAAGMTEQEVDPTCAVHASSARLEQLVE